MSSISYNPHGDGPARAQGPRYRPVIVQVSLHQATRILAAGRWPLQSLNWEIGSHPSCSGKLLRPQLAAYQDAG